MIAPTFRVGPIPVHGDLILSPMDGFSDLPFRLICRELGSAMSYTEFVNVDELGPGRKSTSRAWKKLEYRSSEHPTMAFQLYGHDADRLVEVALRVVEDGQPDILDINMGCYVKSISERGAGSGMLRYPERIADVFRRLSRALPIPVTGKIRLGWDEGSRNYLEIGRILEDNGAALIAVHGRTRAQAYKGEADWDAIAEIKAAVKVPVIGNGGVTHVEDIARIKAHTGCDAVMIGRGAIGNPWIFSLKDREEVSFEERARLMRRHLELNLEFYGPEVGLVLFRKHAARYIRDLPGEEHLRVPLLTATSPEEFEDLLWSAAEPELALAA